jgi:M-phase inducer tyrosine phosphatase
MTFVPRNIRYATSHPQMAAMTRTASNFVPTMPLPQFDVSPGRSSSPVVARSLDQFPGENHFLPILPLSGTVPRITGDTLCDILNGKYDDHFDQLFIVDGRYEYEHKGGCIRGAQHISSSEMLVRSFFKDPIPHALVVFHCEFSHNRGPQLAGLFREIDRNMNRLHYPNLFYPNVYVLDGGYRQFFTSFPSLCQGGYTPMLDENHRVNGDLVKATTKFRENIQRLEAHRKGGDQAAKRRLVESQRPRTLSQVTPTSTKYGHSCVSPLQMRN